MVKGILGGRMNPLATLFVSIFMGPILVVAFTYEFLMCGLYEIFRDWIDR